MAAVRAVLLGTPVALPDGRQGRLEALVVREEGWRLLGLVVGSGWLRRSRAELPFAAVARVAPSRVEVTGAGTPVSSHPPGTFTFDGGTRVQVVDHRLVQRSFWFWGVVLEPEGDAVASLVVRRELRGREPLIFPARGATCQRNDWIWVPAAELEPALLAESLAQGG